MIFPQSDVRNQIISVLSEDFPLTFRKLSNKLKKEHNKTISEKALYRIVGLMTKEGILNKRWNNNTGNFFEVTISFIVK